MSSTLMEGHRTEVQKKQITEDINETDAAKLPHNLEILATWIRSQPHLPQNYDQRMLITFLRGCKHNLENVKRKLDAYFSIRNSHSEFFINRDPYAKEIQSVLECSIIAPLPMLSPDGCRIIYHSIAGDFDFASLVRTILMVSDIRILEEPLLRGDIFVWDVAALEMRHLSRLASPTTKKVLLAAQEAYPQRLHQIHLVNCSAMTEKVVNFFKMFMKPKMRNRWFLHSSHSSLTKHFSRDYIPKEYGGTAPSLQDIQEPWKQKLCSYADWFVQQERVTTDESKRRADGKENKYCNSDQIKGTFRKIQFD